MAIVNIGILAHVDAGKTSLTERILFETGTIASIGSVDRGTTQTDTMELERARGITIRSAVVSFQLGGLKVNLIDTPGHADFVAEVERSLHVLDGVVLVIPAVEGVQPQTRRLLRAVRSVGLPLLIFVNKVDRAGARGDPLLGEIERRLQLRVVPMTNAVGIGGRAVEIVGCDRRDPAWRGPVVDLLAERSDHVIAEFERTDGDLTDAFVAAELRAQVAAGSIVPVYLGSAITGAGVRDLLAGIAEWLPVADEATDAPFAGRVFKIARRSSGEKVAYARLFAGGLTVRERVVIRRRGASGEWERREARLTGIDRFASGATEATDVARAGDIVALHGPRAARIGDRLGLGDARTEVEGSSFPAPAIESVVLPVKPRQLTPLRAALDQLAEQDPLISLRQRNEEGEISVRLYGEIQKEVIMETLSQEYGIDVTFGATRPICIERPVGTGHHVELITDDGNPFCATVGLRVEPGERGTGVRYQRELGALPLAFYRAIEDSVHETLAQGPCGWGVTDCVVTLTHAGFDSVGSTGGDFRKLTPLVLMRALLEAGSDVCEPIEELDLVTPDDTFAPVCGALAHARAIIRSVTLEGSSHRIVCQVPSAELRAVEQRLPGLTHGDGDWSSSFAGYIPVSGDMPTRSRSGPDPRDRARYLAEVGR